MVWDSMLFVNPDTGGNSLQLTNYMVTSHTTSFNGAESSISPGLGTVVGTTTQVWHLRPDLSFHDGTTVTADDICFSILSYRDMPAALIQPSVINVATCTAINASTVQVKLGLSGPFYDDLVGGVPILPHHVWAAACNWPVGSPEPSLAVLGASQCANPADDPMVPLSGQTTGRMIGSGAYMCLGVAGTAAPGVPGGPCSQTASGAPGTSSNTLGGRLLLTKFQGYHRGPVAQQGSKYQKFSWADKFGTGIVTIADIADAALHNKHYDPYWASPLYSSSPATCSATGGPGTGSLQCVDIGDIGTIALYKGIGATDPISLGTFVGLDPHVDRFNSGVAAPSGSVYLGSSSVLKGTTSASFSVFVGSTTTVTGVSVIGTTGLTSTTPGTCTATLVAPDGPGRTTYTCTFGTALAPDQNGDTELEITLTFTGGATTEVEIGQSANSLIAGFCYFVTVCNNPNQVPIPTPGQLVQFTSTVAGSPGYTPVGTITYSWSFGDGSISSAQNPTHAYAAAGTFTATLTETDAAAVSGAQSLTVVVAPFSVSPACTLSGLALTCQAVITNGNGPFTCIWSFGGAGTQTGADPCNPTFTYSATGTYTVSLSVTDTATSPSAANTATSSRSIVVAPFSVAFTCTATGLAVTCSATTTNGNAPFTYKWNFGGAGSGTSLSGPTPTFTYSAAGTYTISLSVKDSTAQTATASQSITV
jgi:PKD repeat protein